MVLTSIYIVKYLYSNRHRRLQAPGRSTIEAVMSPYPYLALHVQEQRAREIHEARLARIASCVRACRAAPTTFIGRLARVLRPAPSAC
jgi:hypothetical protein